MAALLAMTCAAAAQTPAGCRAAEQADIVADVRSVKDASFPELQNVNVGTGTFRSEADYFRTRFSMPRFLFLRPMRYRVEVNPKLFSEGAPKDGVCAILAHELVHVTDLKRGNRLRRLGLVRLLSGRFTARFERKADLEAIARGYGEGLKSYRAWVYGHVPARVVEEKKRRYFSPEEIAAVEKGLREKPGLLEYWRKHVPMGLREIVADSAEEALSRRGR
jgi:hypothetical protein